MSRLSFVLKVIVSLGCFASASGQNRTSDVVQDRVYESFFREVVILPERSEIVDVVLNGDMRIKMYQPSAQEAIGLNDQEGRTLREAALECIASIDALARASVDWRKEAFFQRIESGRASGELERRHQEMQAERLRIVTAAVEKLRRGVDARRFESLLAFIQSRRAERLFFPAVGAP